MASFLSHLEWRHATKAFDPNKPVSEVDLAKVLQAIRMAPTSFGLQPFHVEVVHDKGLKEKLFVHAWKQRQIISCSALLVFVAKTDIMARIDQLLDGVTGGSADGRAKMKEYEGMMRGSFSARSEEDRKVWAAKQAYIALGFAMAACAELQIDSCPMEGFNGPEFDAILGVKAGHFSSVILPIGYRDSAVPAMPKFRFSEKDLFQRK